MKHPISMKIRTNIRKSIQSFCNNSKIEKPLFLVALSGGADSLALASAVAHESHRKNSLFSAGAIIVEHGLQEETKKVAEDTAILAKSMGLDPVLIIPVSITNEGMGAEGDARNARYQAFEEAVQQTQASGVLIGHTMNDQAEQVLLGLARGSGTRSISGIAENRDIFIRPMLNISRQETEESCREMNLDYWVDPHNSHNDYARVRVRNNIIPVMQKELGDSIVSNLANTARLAREDADALDFVTQSLFDSIVEADDTSHSYSVPVSELTKLPVGLRSRIYRRVVTEHFGRDLMSTHCDEINSLITQWNGQKPLNLPGVTVTRTPGKTITFS